MQKNLDKQKAIEEGRTTYIGRPCKTCKSNIRHVSDSGCIECNRQRSKTIQAQKRADGRNKVTRQKYEAGTAGKAARKKYYKSKSAANSRWKYSIQKKYGITEEQYNIMLNEQQGCCKICNTHIDYNGKKLAVDHCHVTGKIRALLCHKCNVGLGNFDDNVELLNSAIKYLELYK